MRKALMMVVLAGLLCGGPAHAIAQTEPTKSIEPTEPIELTEPTDTVVGGFPADTISLPPSSPSSLQDTVPKPSKTKFKQRMAKVKVAALKADSILTTRYFRTSYDTNYVVRPSIGRVTLKLRGNLSGDALHVKANINDVSSKANLHTDLKATLSLGVSYRGLSASFAINPAKMWGKYSDYEFNLAYYSKRLSVDASYHRSATLSGDIQHGDHEERLEPNDVNMRVANLAAFYVFNRKNRFSIPAAFTQSFIQRRSAGAWLLGLSYQGGRIETRDELKERNPNAPYVKLRVSQLGIGGGYGYNLVLGKHRQWLLHGSITPTIVIYNNNKLTINDKSRMAEHIRLNMIFNERAAIVWNFSRRYFANVTFTMTSSIFDDKRLVVNQNKWRLRGAIGVRLF